MADRGNRRNERGFTLSEVLLTVAILTVLVALAMIPIGRMQRELRQTELDAKAEILFQAAQNRLTQLQAAGTPERYQTGYAGEIVRGGQETVGYVYIDRGSQAAKYILPEGQVDEELRSRYWVVEYDRDAASVYAVFYSEEPMTGYGTTKFEANRFRSYRLAGGAVVGYYSGETADAGETGKLELKDAGVTNGERLLVHASCKVPGLRDTLTFRVTIKDGRGNSVTLTPDAEEVEYADGIYTLALVLDDLSGEGALRFARQERLKALLPGSDLTITVEVRSSDNPMVEPVSTELEKTNSLFAAAEKGEASEDYTAVVTCGRHLQNLDRAAANGRITVFQMITRAEQTQDIDFAKNSEDSWRGCYGTRTFTPIENEYLREYESVSKEINGSEFVPVISNLTVAASGDAGLFRSFSGGSLTNIRLSGASVRGTGSVGVLAGSVSGSVSVNGCQVYLSSEHLTNANRTKHWLTGGIYTGGLIGTVGGTASLTVEGSLSATVADGVSAAGGLLGRVVNGANVRLSRSYADCYLYGGTGSTGGLIGTSGEDSGVGTSLINLENCYAAGFQQASTTAGLSAGRLHSIKNSYTACAPLEGEQLTYSTVYESQIEPSRVYYLNDGKTNLSGTTYVSWTQSSVSDAAELLGDAFTPQTAGSSYPYNLLVTGLTSYTYPRLKELPHYGDWRAAFLSGSLAYFEHYTDGTGGDVYGLWVAGMDDAAPLRDDLTVLGDGYGVVYDQEPAGNVTVIYDGQSYGLSKSECIRISADVTGKTYYLLKLPQALNDPAFDETAGFYHRLAIGDAVSYYNPYFANTMLPSVTEDIQVSSITIRTARQLYALSRYYGAYAAGLEAKGGISQRRDISYGGYDWANYSQDKARPTTQPPIGTSESPFKHTYDGGCFRIEGAPLAEQSGDCIGLFGRSSGTLKNIVLLADDTAQAVGFKDGVHTAGACAGALIGWNDGHVENCAAAGYRVEAVVSGSELYVGGMIGQNAGTVVSCSVSSPSVRATNYHAQLRIGGFVGSNSGSGRINSCYAMAAVSVPDSRNGEAVLGGFAGENRRLIRSSYCAAAMDAAEEARAYGFALSTDGGGVSGCYYVDGSTYHFAGKNHVFNSKDSGSKANAVSVRSVDLETRSDAVERLSEEFQPLKNRTSDDYPYLAIVKDAHGERVHYGDWATLVNAGELGMFYWEHEVGSANEGYHISFIGFAADGDKRTGSSLCTSHDDGGVIAEYGYGYYWETDTYGANGPTLSYRVAAGGGNNGFSLGAIQGAVNLELNKQMPKYTFVSFRTGADGLHLQSADTANGVWLLESRSGETSGNTFAYALNPFFADSFAYLGTNMSAADAVMSAADLGKTGTKAAGKTTGETFYQIRSVEQLQFINWSWADGKGSTDRVVTNDTYQKFPYLQYTTVDVSWVGENNKQTRTGAEKERPARSWKQTHDLNGADRTSPADGTKNMTFHPVAGAEYWTNSYKVILYNWFGGIYDGQNYYIKNVNIDSKCYNVGLFGTTAGAVIQNIVLYSDNDGVIQRKTEKTDMQTAYALGGLVGIAYEYSGDGEAEITNCAIAGYKIEDNSKNKLQLGEAVVGGLIGVSKVNLNSCSAVVDIAVNCTHREASDDNWLNYAAYGNYIRVGGMVGGVQKKVTNCYTGGKITIGADTLNERVKDWTNKLVPVKDSGKVQWVNKTDATYVYIGGIGGSGFSSNFTNFSGKDTTDDGKPSYENCYTYVEFPKMEGTIMAISRIGSIADRYGEWGDAALTIKNCYYLKSEIAYNLPKYYHYQENHSLNDILTNDEKEKMLNGDLSYVNLYFEKGRGKDKYTIDNLVGLTYQQLAGKEDIGSGKERILALLNGSGETFRMVTTRERGTPVYGKYSFPGDTAEVRALKGQDYPFPTVLRQENAFGDTVSLHYGRWPVQGLVWGSWTTDKDGKQVLLAESEKSIDLITEAGKGSISLAMMDVEKDEIGSAVPELTYSTTGVFQEEAPQKDSAAGRYTVGLTAERLGSTWITATMNGYTAHLLASVTARVDIVVTRGTAAVEDAVAMKKNSTLTLKLSAQDKNGKPLTVAWSVDSDFADALGVAVNANGDLTLESGELTGEVTLRLTAVYRLGGASYTGVRSLTVVIAE